MGQSKFVFFSDVHIGTNAPSNWYQASVHEPYLLAALEHIRADADDVREFVLVGDLVDQWTYAPSTRPPSFAEIAAANPNVFGGDRVPGAFVELLAALKGRVTYVNGNHDMALTAADFAALHDPAGQGVRVVSGPLYEPEASKGHIVCTHGHIYSMLNAPDPLQAALAGLPIGHFIARLAALWVQTELAKLPPGSTAADLSSSGDPTGWSLDKDALINIGENVLSHGGSLARAVIGTLLELTQQPSNLSFELLDGSAITATEVMDRYDGLLDSWRDSSRFPEAIYGSWPWFYALAEVDLRNSLRHFADVLGRRHKVVVMGHTHVPDDRSERVSLVGSAVYANSGFGCPSVPDMNAQRAQHPTFVEVAIDEDARRYVTRVRYVVNDDGKFRVAPEPLEPVKITSMD